MIYITGDCHADYSKFSNKKFPQQKEMTKNDFVIVCGDFGIWHDSNNERYWLDWLDNKPFTTLFVDGNHENFDRLYSDEFPIVDFHGGKAHKIRDSIYHLMRGNVFELEGKKFFAFGGASSHDIQDGILDEGDYQTFRDMINDYRKKTEEGKYVRINHLSWWKEELPSDEERQYGLDTLAKHDFKVDYVISHCMPQRIASFISNGRYKPDAQTLYFNRVAESLDFKCWYGGHYHKDCRVMRNYHILYHNIIRIK